MVVGPSLGAGECNVACGYGDGCEDRAGGRGRGRGEPGPGRGLLGTQELGRGSWLSLSPTLSLLGLAKGAEAAKAQPWPWTGERELATWECWGLCGDGGQAGTEGISRHTPCVSDYQHGHLPLPFLQGASHPHI